MSAQRVRLGQHSLAYVGLDVRAAQTPMEALEPSPVLPNEPAPVLTPEHELIPVPTSDPTQIPNESGGREHNRLRARERRAQETPAQRTERLAHIMNIYFSLIVNANRIYTYL